MWKVVILSSILIVASSNYMEEQILVLLFKFLSVAGMWHSISVAGWDTCNDTRMPDLFESHPCPNPGTGYASIICVPATHVAALDLIISS